MPQGADGKLAFGRGSAAILGMIVKHTGQPVDQIELGISFVDAAKAVDMRYAIALPEK